MRARCTVFLPTLPEKPTKKDMKTLFERNPYRTQPDGTTKRMFPFHICIEGLEKKILCRDESDYDVFVKIISIATHRKQAILVIYTVVSNHMHCIILATDTGVADSVSNEIKKLYSMYLNKKYKDSKVLKRNNAKALFLDSDYYVRNAIAYVVRNALDNGVANVQDYKWTGFRAVFCRGEFPPGKNIRQVRSLKKDEKRLIMHSGDKLDDVGWMIDEENRLVPVSICDWRYVESAFYNDQSFFLRMIGGVNTPEMNNKLLIAPRTRRTDNELLLSVNEISQRWFGVDVQALSNEKKSRLLKYVNHSYKTTPAQLARTFEIDNDVVVRMLGH